MALLATQTVTDAGITPAYGAASAGGDTFQPGDDVFLHVKNASGASVTVTVASQKPCNHGTTHNAAVAVPAGAERMLGPFPAERWASPASGLVSVTYSATASVTVAVVRA